MNAVKTKKHIFPVEWIEDNENLIAAAPELLKTLQSYVDSMLEKDQQEKWFNQYKNDPQANQVLVAAISVIQKATL